MSAEGWMRTYEMETTPKSHVLGQDASLSYFTEQHCFVYLVCFGYLVVIHVNAGAAHFKGSKEWCNN